MVGWDGVHYHTVWPMAHYRRCTYESEMLKAHKIYQGHCTVKVTMDTVQ